MVKVVCSFNTHTTNDRYCTGKKGHERLEDWPSDGLVLENVGDKPTRFRTRKQLEKYCKKVGVRSGALQ